MGTPRVIPDFLPSPRELVLKEDAVKITVQLSKKSVDFFKREASRYKIPYQKMIRRVLDLYTEKYE